MRNTVANELYFRMSREDSSQQIAKCMVFIVEHISSAVLVVLFLLNSQTLLSFVLIFHVLLQAGFFGKYFFLFRHHLLRLRHRNYYYVINTLRTSGLSGLLLNGESLVTFYLKYLPWRTTAIPH